MGDTLPLYPYSSYPHNILNYAHYADQYIPLIAMIYTLSLFLIYLYQYITRRKLWFTPITLSLHLMGIIALFILFLYELLLYLLSSDYYKHLVPSSYYIMY